MFWHVIEAVSEFDTSGIASPVRGPRILKPWFLESPLPLAIAPECSIPVCMGAFGGPTSERNSRNTYFLDAIVFVGLGTFSPWIPVEALYIYRLRLLYLGSAQYCMIRTCLCAISSNMWIFKMHGDSLDSEACFERLTPRRHLGISEAVSGYKKIDPRAA